MTAKTLNQRVFCKTQAKYTYRNICFNVKLQIKHSSLLKCPDLYEEYDSSHPTTPGHCGEKDRFLMYSLKCLHLIAYIKVISKQFVLSKGGNQ